MKRVKQMNTIKQVPYDVFTIMIDKIKDHLCPVYIENDVWRDINSLAKSLKLNIENKDLMFVGNEQRFYNTDTAYQFLGLTAKEFKDFSKTVKTYGFSKKGYLRLDGMDLRAKILENNHNCVGQWLSSMIKKRTQEDVPIWFCYLLLPISERFDRITFHSYAKLWQSFQSTNKSHDVIKFIKDNNKIISELFIFDFKQKFCSNDIKKELVLSLFNNQEYPLYKELLNSNSDLFTKETYFRASLVNKRLVYQDWITLEFLNKIHGYIMNGQNDSIEKLIEDCSYENIRLKTRHYGVEEIADNFEIEFNDHLFTEDTVDDLIQLEIIRMKFDLYDMTVLEDDLPIFLIYDQETGITTQDLADLIKNFPNEFEPSDHIQLRIFFDRYKELKDELIKAGLELRNDSKLCEAYVEAGEYIGPTAGFSDTMLKNPLQCVVAMMIEMDFLFRETRYRTFLSIMRWAAVPINSKMAKHAALYEYDEDKTAVPERLVALSKDKQILHKDWLEIMNLEYDYSWDTDWDNSDYEYI